jgi:magnesium-dependent phosphatase-1
MIPVELAAIRDALNKIADRPKLFVFDLDNTLWSSQDAARTQPPYRRSGENHVHDGQGIQIKIHSDTKNVLQAIRSCEGRIAVASLNAKEANCVSILRECKHTNKTISHCADESSCRTLQFEYMTYVLP